MNALNRYGLALVFAVIHRDNRALAPVLILGSVLAFDTLAFLSGNSFGWLRFYITEIPLAILCAACIPAVRLPVPRRKPKSALVSASLTFGRVVVNTVLACAAFALVAPSLPSTWATMLNHRLGREESHHLTALFDPAHERGLDATAINAYHVERRVASFIDAMHLPHGSVLTDSGNSFAVLVSTRDLKAFVIDSDLDFERAVADPPRFHVHYLLVPKGSYYDAIDSAYPGVYDNGGGFSTLVKEWKGTGYTPDWRLYRITAQAFAADHDVLGGH